MSDRHAYLGVGCTPAFASWVLFFSQKWRPVVIYVLHSQWQYFQLIKIEDIQTFEVPWHGWELK